jgi:hypothetical protein
MPFGCTAPPGAPASSFPGAPRAPGLPNAGLPQPGDIVQVAGGIAGIVLQVIAGIAQIQTPTGQVQQVPVQDVTVTDRPTSNGFGEDIAKMAPWLLLAGLLVVLATRR